MVYLKTGQVGYGLHHELELAKESWGKLSRKLEEHM